MPMLLGFFCSLYRSISGSLLTLLHTPDSFAPRAWAVREAVQGGYALEAAGLVPNSAGAESSRPNGGMYVYICICIYECVRAFVCVCVCACVYAYIYA
jgi:hypothetical protein